MSDIIELATKRQPVNYTVRITHNWDGSLEFLIEDVSDDPRSRASVLDAFRRILSAQEPVKEPEVALAIAYECGFNAGVEKELEAHKKTRNDLRLAVMADGEYTKELDRQIGDAMTYAVNLAIALREKHFPEVTEWKPLSDLVGVLTQIDNMTSALKK